MESLPGSEPVADDELLYRRVPSKLPFYDPQADPPVSPEAFKATKDDVSGLSASRAKYTNPEQAARHGRGSEYHIAVLRAGDLRKLGLDIVPKPEPDDPGHVEIPGLRRELIKTTEVDRLRISKEVCREVLGPFPGKSAS